MVITQMPKKQYLQNVLDTFQEGDTLKWDNDVITHYNWANHKLSEFNTRTTVTDIY